MGLTIIRRVRPPWMRARSSWPAVMEMPPDWENGDPLPRHYPIELRNRREQLIWDIAQRRVAGGATAAAYAVNSAIFAAPAALHSILNVIAPSGHGLSLVEAAVSFDGVTASNVPVYVEICQSTQGAAGTGGTAPTIAQVRGRSTSGSAPTAAGSFTVEPTTLTRTRSWYVSPNNGLLIYPLPLGRELECDSSGGTIRAHNMRITPPNTVNAQAYMEVEALG